MDWIGTLAATTAPSVALWAAFGGAVLGGSVAFLGSWFISRSEHRRTQEVALLTLDLPELERLMRGTSQLTEDAAAQASIVANRAIASRIHSKIGRRIAAATLSHRVAQTQVEHDGQGGFPLSAEGQQRAKRAVDSIREAHRQLEADLRKRFTSPWWRRRQSGKGREG